MGQKGSSVQEFLGQKEFGLKILGPKRFLVQKDVVSKRIFSPKNVESKTFQGKKKFWVLKKSLVVKFLGPKTFFG